MEIGPMTPRPVASNATPVTRVAASRPTEPVRTELPAFATVTQSPEAPAQQRQPPTSDSLDRRIEIDPATQEVVFQAIDPSSGEIVRQVPDEALRRMQIYARALRRGPTMRRSGPNLGVDA